MGFSRQEYWSGVPSRGSFPHEPVSPARQANSLLSEALGKPYFFYMGLLLKYLLQFLYSLLKPLRKPDLCPQILQVKKFTLIVFPISTHA